VIAQSTSFSSEGGRIAMKRGSWSSPGAAAATDGIPVVTANVSDFSIFKGLTVQNWMAVVR